jgi:restriction system protein
MAKSRSLWTELQRELARRQRLQQQADRVAQQAAARAIREEQQVRHAKTRQAASDEKERKRLYVEDRKEEAASTASALAERMAELDSVLTAGVRPRPAVTFASLKRTAAFPAFTYGGLDRPAPQPQWEQFAAPPPSGLGRMFGGSGRYERLEAAAREAYNQACEQHATAEADRQRRLADRRREYDRQAAAAADATAAHNAEVDQFEHDFQAGEPEAVAQFFTFVLDSSVYPEGFAHRTRVLYRPEPKEVVVEFELPPQSLIPVERDYKYVMARDEITSLARPVKEIKDRYARLVAQVALRTIHEVFVYDPTDVAAVVTFNGHLSTKDLATGQPIRPCLISVSAEQKLFRTFVLTELDPLACLRKLNALVSNHPYDLEAVRPVVDFEALLTRYKFVEGMDAVAGLDSRRDLLDMTPTEFEHLVRQLFEKMGMKAWNTQASKDDGVDAVATNEDPVFGGLCIIQAKRYRGAVGVEPVRALAGVMEDKRATKGIMVTTSWVTKDGHAFAHRHGRIQIIECEEIKYLCQEHLGLDVLISLPKPPPQRRS